MALSDEDKKTITDMFAEAVTTGLAKWQSDVEEKRAKEKPVDPPADKKEGNDGGFDFGSWLLGG